MILCFFGLHKWSKWSNEYTRPYYDYEGEPTGYGYVCKRECARCGRPQRREF